MDTTLEFPSSSSTPWCCGLLDSDVGTIIFPTPMTPLQLRWAFRHHRSSLAESEHTIAFVSWFPFRFAVQSSVSWSSPSNPYLSSSLFLFGVTMTGPSSSSCSVRLPCAYGWTESAMSFSRTRCILAAPWRHWRTIAAPPRAGTRAGRQPALIQNLAALPHPLLVSTSPWSHRSPLPVPRQPNRQQPEALATLTPGVSLRPCTLATSLDRTRGTS
jgi:hypothetical protein